MRIPRTEYIASQALPAASVFLVGDTFEFPWGTDQITFYVTYTRGADGGEPQFQFDIGNGTELCRTTIPNGASLAISEPNGSVNILLERVNGPVPDDGTAICYILRVCTAPGERTLRMSVREIGVWISWDDCCSPDWWRRRRLMTCCGSGVIGGGASPPGGGPQRIGRTEHLADQTLPAAGAFTNQAVFDIPEGITKIAFEVTYTRGVAGGYPIFNTLWGDGVVEARDLVEDQGSLAIAGDEGLFNMYLSGPLGPPPTTDDPVVYVLEYEVPGGESTVRVLMAEWGQTLTPGDASIYLTAR